jgi:protein-disulfide isomerase
MKENKTIIVIALAAILIAGSLIFLGLKLGSGNQGNTQNQLSFADQLEEYQKVQEQAQVDAQAEQLKVAEQQAKDVVAPNEDDHILGDRDALISIIEYSDFECPFCKRFYKTPKQAIADNPGVVNSVFRHFPLGFHDPLATKQALASECVADIGGSEKFWQYHDKIFETTDSNGKGMEVSELTTLAKEVGVNTSEFQACLDSEKFLAEVQADMKSGADAGVTGTPGNIIRNNKTGEVRFLPGAYPIEAIQAAIDELK